MKKLIVLFILVTLLSAKKKYKDTLKGDEYQSKSAQEKFDMTKERIKQSQGSHGNWPSALSLGKLFIQDNNNSFLPQDDMPRQGYWIFRHKRQKLIHIVGTIAEMEYVSVSDKYSGIFAKGATKGFGRFSMATQPEKNQISPGMTFKWFRDGQPSANWFCLHALQGFENDSNVFAKDYSNHIPMYPYHFSIKGLKYKLLIKSFQKVSDWPAFLGLSDTATWDEKGNKSKDVNFPFRLQFQPVQETRDMMKSDLKITDYYYLPLLEGYKVETLFNVYAQETPESEDLELIGHVKMKTPFKQSSYIDDTMYFQHMKFEQDLKHKPEWSKPSEKLVDWQGNRREPYTYPNVPYEK